MKKIIVITPACHFKNQGAAQKDIYATVRLLKNLGHHVVLYTLHSPAQDEETVRLIADELRVECVLFRPKENPTRWLVRVLKNPALFDRAAAGFAELAEDSRFGNYVKEFRPDIIFSFCSYSWPILAFARKRGIAGIFRSHNFEASFFLESLSFFQKMNPLDVIRFLAKYRGEYLATKHAEKIGSLPFDEITKYQKWQPNKTEILTLVFLPESIRPPHVHTEKKPIDLFFLGASYNIVFHRRGAELLIRQIAPRVLARAPGQFRFHICGGKLPEYLVKQCNRDTIMYEGYVPDLEHFLDSMDAGVFPVMTGKTMKGKVFETLCRSFPMIIPSIGRGGYILRDEEEVLIADSVNEFVAQTLRLSDPVLRKTLAENAHDFAEKELGANAIAAVFRKIIGE